MKLINTHTYELETFYGSDVPEYAILSHTWDKEEVTFQDWETAFADPPNALARLQTRLGFEKIERARVQALKDGLRYLWVDTNCIDKSSSAELSEAINSMFAYYRDAQVCYVYLQDFHLGSPHDDPAAALPLCRWFTRGWTLQELIAPRDVRFYDGSWHPIGDKQSLAPALASITGISTDYLAGHKSIQAASVAHRMAWAARRTTTRTEDMAYCMLGIFDVNMPLLYGEGTKAFVRLQEEIIKSSADETLFCWTYDSAVPRNWVSMLAPSPAVFRDAGHFETYRVYQGRVAPYSVTNQGLSVHLMLLSVRDGYLGVLNAVALGARLAEVVAIPLEGHLSTAVMTRARYPLSPVRLPDSVGGLSTYLDAVEDQRTGVFVRLRAADDKTSARLKEEAAGAGAGGSGGAGAGAAGEDQLMREEASHEVLLLIGSGGSPIEVSALPADRLVRGMLCLRAGGDDGAAGEDGAVLCIRREDKPAKLIFFGVKGRKRVAGAVWNCKFLEPYHGSAAELAGEAVGPLMRQLMAETVDFKPSDESVGSSVQLGDEFEAGYGRFMRVAHIHVSFDE